MRSEPDEGKRMSVTAARRLRRTMTEAERRLWLRLRNRGLAGFKFRRQAPLGPYVLDFFCEETRLVVEVDGGQHADPGELDARRTGWLTAHRCTILRVWNNEVMDNLEGVLETIRAALPARPHPARAVPAPTSPRGRG